MSAASERQRRRASRWLLAFVAALYAGCGFPEHTFIPDDEFEGVGGSAGATAGKGGALGSPSGGSSGARGSGGALVDAGSDVSAGGAAGAGTGAGAAASGRAGSSAAGGTLGTGAGAAGTRGGGSGGAGTSGADAGAGAAGLGGMSGGGAAGSAGAGGSGGATEICSNGSDDDGDNLVDCADDDCTKVGFQCATKPDDWSGPVALQTGPTADNPPNCSGEYPTVSANLNRALNAPPANCTPCGCAGPTGATCSTPIIGLWTNATCSSSIGWFNLSTTPAGMCRSYTLQGPDAGALVPVSASITTPSTPSGGSCQESGGNVNLPALGWNERGRACEERQGGSLARGCGTNLCLAPAPAGFNRGVCIFKAGDNACPGPAFTNKIVLYGSLTDSRSCTACRCNAPTGIQCRGTVSVYESNCSTQLGSLFSATDCIPVTPVLSKAFRFNPTIGDPQGGSCTATGGAPTGAALPSNPTTYCCL